MNIWDKKPARKSGHKERNEDQSSLLLLLHIDLNEEAPDQPVPSQQGLYLIRENGN